VELNSSRKVVIYSHAKEFYQNITEPEEELSTGLYPEPDQSSSYHPILYKIHLNIIVMPTF
jgi:hypothetical protein